MQIFFPWSSYHYRYFQCQRHSPGCWCHGRLHDPPCQSVDGTRTFPTSAGPKGFLSMEETLKNHLFRPRQVISSPTGALVRLSSTAPSMMAICFFGITGCIIPTTYDRLRSSPTYQDKNLLRAPRLAHQDSPFGWRTSGHRAHRRWVANHGGGKNQTNGTLVRHFRL